LLLLSGEFSYFLCALDLTNKVSSIPALFRYELLSDNTLHHRETIPLPGNPLDVEAIDTPGAAAATTPRLLVALYPTGTTEGDNSASSSLIALDKSEAGWRQSKVENLPAGGEIEIGETELQKILYSTESLRKLSDFD
jgi:tRNA (guanine-N(7)-)-methyltransferase subunit TRM82